MVCKKHLPPEKGGPRKLSRARKHWMTSRLMIIWAKRFLLCVMEAIAQSTTRDLLRRLLVQIEPILRRVVKEEVEKGIDRYWSRVPRPIDYNICPRYKLCFLTKMKKFIYTMHNVKGESGSPIQVSVLDTHRRTVNRSPFASARVKIVALHGNFCADGRETWTRDEFDKSMVSKRNEKREALLAGNLEFRLENGAVSIRNAWFSDISKWAGGGKFRLGVKLIDDVGERVREGISNPFKVKHRRGKGSEKVASPSLDDEVWKLEKIAKDGVVHKKLEQEGIYTVGELLKCIEKDEYKIRKILGHTSKITIQHAKKCTQGDNVGQEIVALFPDTALAADNMLRTKLPNGVSIEGLEEMVQPFNLSNQINPPQTIYNTPGQNEINNPAPPNVGNFYHGSSSSRPDPLDNYLMEQTHQGQVAAPEGIPDIAEISNININQYFSVSVDIARKQHETTSDIYGNCHIGTNNPVPPIDGNFFCGSSSSHPDPFDYLTVLFNEDNVASPKGNPDRVEKPMDIFDIDQYLQEPDPAEVDNCRYKGIYDDFSKALTGKSGLLFLRKMKLKVGAAVKWVYITKQSVAKRARPAL